MNHQEYDAVMLRLTGTYHQQPPTEQLRREFERVLADYPVDAVNRAIDAYVEDAEYFPKPSQLLALIDRSPALATAPCGVCEGTGWIETTAPSVDDAGNKAQGREAGWVYKCKVCAGSGRGHGDTRPVLKEIA